MCIKHIMMHWLIRLNLVTYPNKAVSQPIPELKASPAHANPCRTTHITL